MVSETRMVERVRCAGNAGNARAVPTPVPISRSQAALRRPVSPPC
jgi:hypothetical protein